VKPRVFVSHGAGQDEDVWAIVRAIRDALDAGGFRPFVDETRIPPGQEWRPEIEAEIPGCHAGVLVLSERALTRPWVIAEATLLGVRSREPGAFALVPVLVDVGAEALEQFGPAGVAANNPVYAAEPAATAEQVLLGLEAVRLELQNDRELAWKPLLRSTIKDADPGALRAAAAALGEDLDTWPWSNDRPGAVAHWMLKCRDVGTLFDAAKALRDNDANVDARAAFELALPHAWIDWDGARCVGQAVDAGEAVALDSPVQQTGQMYLRRASTEYQVATVASVNGEDDRAPLLEEVSNELARLIFAGPATLKDLQDELPGERVVLVLGFEPPSREAIVEVKKTFASIGLVFCADARPEPMWLELQGDVRTVQPPVNRQQEDLAMRKARRAGALRRSTSSGT
jgi:hypothetical protein